MLYELATGKDRQKFPEPPTRLGDFPDRERFLELDAVISRACARETRERYASAQMMHEDLLLLQAGASVRRLRRLQRRVALTTRIVGAAAVLLLVLGGGWFYASKKAAQEAEQRKVVERANRMAQAANQKSRIALETMTQIAIRRVEELLATGKTAEALANLANVVRINPSNRVAPARLISLLMYRNFALPALAPFQQDGRTTDGFFSADGRYVAVSSSDGKAFIWDAVTGALVTGPIVHEKEINQIRFSPNGEWVAICSEDKIARVWTTKTGQPVTSPLKLLGEPMCTEFSPDGNRLAVATRGPTSLQVWDIALGVPVLTRTDLHSELQVRFSADGRLLVVSGYGKIARIVDAGTGALIHELRHERSIGSLSFSRDGAHVVTGSRDHAARVWDVSSGQPVTEPLRHQAELEGAEFSPDGQRVVTASKDKTAVIWDAHTGKKLLTLEHLGPVRSAVFSHDGLKVVTAGQDKTARVWNSITGEPLIEPIPHPEDLFYAEFDRSDMRIPLHRSVRHPMRSQL